MNGYFNNYFQLQLLINDHSPSIICIQETHLKYNINPNIPSQYFSIFHNNSNHTTSKQGIGILVRKNINYNIININSNFLVIAIEINMGIKFALLNIYIPPNQPFSASDINNIISQINIPIILVGDCNAWSDLWGSPASNNRGKALEDVILASNLAVLNNGSPTHFSTHKTFTHVDISLCSSHLLPITEWKISNNLYGSDHYPIFTYFHINQRTTIFKPKPKFKTNFANWPKFEKLCDSLSSKTTSSQNINKEAANIQKSILTAAHFSIPQTKYVWRKHNLPWWNQELQILRDQKQKAWSEYKRNRSNELLLSFKKTKAQFRYHSKKAKNQSLENFTSSINPLSTTQKIWNDIKTLTGTNKSQPVQLLVSTNNTISNPLEIANAFAENWSNFSLDSNFSVQFISNKQNVLSSPYNPNNLSPSARQINQSINISELELVLAKVKGKTPGADRISYPMLKNISIDLKSRILNLFNHIFNTGIIPQYWKTANIIPIAKPNKNPTDINGYRPISLIPCTSKILEKIVANRLMWFAQKNKFLSPHQFAFKKSQGTNDVLLLFDNFVTQALSSSNHITTLSIDFQKAFDRIGIHIILRQLQKWKVGSKIYNFVKSFLTNRKFKVIINNTSSIIKPLSNGIPQGSPLSVVMFIIAFDEISQILSQCKLINHCLYADDLIIFTKILDLNKVTETFNDILDKLSFWSDSSGACISYEKSNILHICRKTSCSNFVYSYNNVNINIVSVLRILGLFVDNKYTFKSHCTILRKNLAQRLNIIKYLSYKHSHVHPTTLINITKAIILSKIDYGLSVYGKCAISHLKILYHISIPYHSAIRRSIRAFPTSNTANIPAESGVPSVLER